MNLDYSKLKDLEELYGDSFYLLRENDFIQNINEFRESFKKYYKNVAIGYSYKTNYIPYVCKVANDNNVYAEVVSEMELSIAQNLSIEPSRIIYNGPCKTKKSLEYCLLNKSIVNIDNLSELFLVEEITKKYLNVDFSIGIRLNLNLNDGFDSRFGFDVESKDFQILLDKIKQIDNLSIVGLHTHSTRPDKSVNSYLNKLDLLYDCYKKYFGSIDLKYLDLGGGFFGKMDDQIKEQFKIKELISFTHYGQKIGEKMKRLFENEGPILFLEPGLALTVNILDFVCKVENIKTINQNNIATTTGSFHNIKPSGHKVELTMQVFNPKDCKNINRNYKICGYTCLENDVLRESYIGTIDNKTYCLFKNVGAYTLVFKPPFIKLSPPIIAFDEGEFKEIKKAENFQHSFSSYNFNW